MDIHRIGQAGIGKGNEYFVGQIDEVRIFTKTLNNAEIEAFCACKLS